jgi:hypothetical protein
VGESAAAAPGPPRRTDVAGSHGFQVGDGNVQNIYYQPDDGRPSGPVVAGEIPQELAAFQSREELLGVLRSAGPGVSLVAAVTGMREWARRSWRRRSRANAGWRLVGWVDT